MNTKKITSALLLALALPISGFAKDKLIPEGKFIIDSMHSKIGFEIPHLVISTVEGQFKQFAGTIVTDKQIGKSTVEFSADINSIDTGVTKRDDHLKSPDFFDATKFPKMTFMSSKVSASGNAITLAGLLTIKDKSKAVVINAKYLGTVKDGYGQEKIAFRGSTKINRKDFGLTWNNAVEAGPVVGDEVEINLILQATKEVTPSSVPEKK